MSDTKYLRLAQRLAFCLRDNGWSLGDDLLKVCPACGFELVPASRYCHQCGCLVPFEPDGTTLRDLSIAIQYALEDEL